MRYIKTRWKENLCNSRGSMLWSLLDRNNNKEAKVYARRSKYQSVTPCSYFFNQASFRQTSLVSTNESRFDKRVSFRLTSLVSTNESRFDKRVPSLYSRTNESRWKSFIEWLINRDDLKSSGFPETVSDPTFLGRTERNHIRLISENKPWHITTKWQNQSEKEGKELL